MSLELPKRENLNRPLTVKEFDQIVDAIIENRSQIDNLKAGISTNPKAENVALLKSQTSGDSTTISGADIDVKCGLSNLVVVEGDTSTLTTTLDNVNVTFEVVVPDVTQAKRQTFVFKRTIDCSKDTMNDKAIANALTLNIKGVDVLVDSSSLNVLVDFYKKSDKAIKDETNSTSTIAYIAIVDAIIGVDGDGKKYLMLKATSHILPANPEGLTININS